MRILHITGFYKPAFEWGGPARSISQLAEATATQGADIEVITTNARGGKIYEMVQPGTQRINDVLVTYCQACGPRRLFYAPTMANAIKCRLPYIDVVHIHGLWAFPVVRAARLAERAGVPYVISPRGSLDPWALKQKRWKKHPYMWLFERRTLKQSSLLHFTANDERDHSPLEFRSLPSVVIPNCVEMKMLLALERHKNNHAQNLEILILGRIHPMKGFDFLIPAFRRVVNLIPQARLLIVGSDEGGYKSTVERLVEKYELCQQVQFLGHLDAEDCMKLFQRVALLVAPSYRENFGMSIAEAMASGIPVVVSKHVNISDEIKLANAGIVISLDPNEIADAIVRLLLDPLLARTMGLNGRGHASTHYSVDGVGKKMIDAYKQISDSSGSQL